VAGHLNGLPVGPSITLPLSDRHPLPPMPAVVGFSENGEPERADAARNRHLLMEAASRLIGCHGAAAVTMDAVAKEAGVGKGTVFRRFGNRTGLMLALLNHSESELQRAFLTGPAPLGPGDPGELVDARDRLVAFGRARLAMNESHLDILLEAESIGPERFNHPAHVVSSTHIRMLLNQIGFRGNLEVLCTAILAPLEAGALYHMRHDGRMTIEQIGDHWEALVRALAPTGP
jgi:AcrR family transcriptional regulator